MSATVTTLPVAKPKRTIKRAAKSAAAKPQAQRRERSQTMQGIVSYAVGGTLLALSLDHLATGIAAQMHLPLWQAGIMAVAVDVGFVSTEFMPFTCTKATLDDTRWIRHGFAAAMFLASGLFNAMSIGTGWQAYVTGYAIPAVIATCLALGSRCILGRSK